MIEKQEEKFQGNYRFQTLLLHNAKEFDICVHT